MTVSGMKIEIGAMAPPYRVVAAGGMSDRIAKAAGWSGT